MFEDELLSWRYWYYCCFFPFWQLRNEFLHVEFCRLVFDLLTGLEEGSRVVFTRKFKNFERYFLRLRLFGLLKHTSVFLASNGNRNVGFLHFMILMVSDGRCCWRCDGVCDGLYCGCAWLRLCPIWFCHWLDYFLRCSFLDWPNFCSWQRCFLGYSLLWNFCCCFFRMSFVACSAFFWLVPTLFSTSYNLRFLKNQILTHLSFIVELWWTFCTIILYLFWYLNWLRSWRGVWGVWWLRTWNRYLSFLNIFFLDVLRDFLHFGNLRLRYIDFSLPFYIFNDVINHSLIDEMSWFIFWQQILSFIHTNVVLKVQHSLYVFEDLANLRHRKDIHKDYVLFWLCCGTLNFNFDPHIKYTS